MPRGQVIRELVEEHREEITRFLRDLCAIRSMDGRPKEMGDPIIVDNIASEE